MRAEDSEGVERGAAAIGWGSDAMAELLCRLTADGVVPRDLRPGPAALAAVAEALRRSGLIPADIPDAAPQDPVAAALDYSYLG